MSGKYWVVLGALSMAAAVSAGAVGTHVLKEVFKYPQAKLETFEVGVRYQIYHALGLVLVGILAMRARSRWLATAGTLFVAGTVLFSGGIYGWVFADLKPFVQVVPVGGMAFILGWVVLAIGTLVGRDSVL